MDSQPQEQLSGAGPWVQRPPCQTRTRAPLRTLAPKAKASLAQGPHGDPDALWSPHSPCQSLGGRVPSALPLLPHWRAPALIHLKDCGSAGPHLHPLLGRPPGVCWEPSVPSTGLGLRPGSGPSMCAYERPCPVLGRKKGKVGMTRFLTNKQPVGHFKNISTPWWQRWAVGSEDGTAASP